MVRVLVAGKVHPDGLALLKRPDVQLDYVEEVSAASYRPYLKDAEALLIRTQPLSGEFIAEAPNLKIVSRHGVGYDAVDVKTLNSRGIPLTVVGDVNSRAVAEHAVMLMLAAARRTVLFDRKTRSGEWNYRNSLDMDELDGRSLLVVGFGRIGRRVAQIGAALGMDVSAHDRFQSDDAIEEQGVRVVGELADGLREADVVSLHLPKVGDQPLIGRDELALMKRSAILINTARGGLIDEQALADALNGGLLAAAGLDVFNDEPPAADNPLLGCERAILSPHNAGLTVDCARRMAIVAAQNILDHFAGRLDTSLIVNHEDIATVAKKAVSAL
jgi:D-3-phosphoglycerate dehydrogenase